MDKTKRPAARPSGRKRRGTVPGKAGKVNKPKRPKAKREPIRRTARGALVSLAILAISALSVWNHDYLAMKAYSLLPMGMDRLSVAGNIPLSQTSLFTDVSVVHGMVFVAEDNKLKAYSGRMEPMFERPFISASSDIMELGRDILVVSYSTGDIYVLGTDGSIKAKRISGGDIGEVKVSEGQVAVKARGDFFIEIFDNRLQSIRKINIPGGNVTSWDFSPSLKRVATSVVSTTSDGIMSSIHMFDYESQLSESVSLDDNAIYRVDYRGDRLRAVSDRAVTVWSMPSGKRLFSRETDSTTANLEFCDNGDILINTAGADVKGSGANYINSATLLSGKDRVITHLSSLDGSATHINRAGSGILVVYGEEAVIYGENGEEAGKIQVKEGLQDVACVDPMHVAFIYKDRVEVLRCLTG